MAQGTQVCHCEAPTGPWQSHAGSCDFADGFPVVRPCSARLPRRFAPRNDTSGERAVHQCTCAVELPSARCSGNAAAFPIGAISRFLRKKIPEAQASGNFSLSKKSLWAFSPSCFQNCKIKFCSMILQFCRCGGLWNAKGNPDGFLSHYPSLRNFRLDRFFDSLKLPEAQASGSFSNTIKHNQSQSIIYFAKTFFRRAKRGRPSS